MRNGVLATEQQPFLVGIVDGICDFGEIPSTCTIFMRDATTGDVFVVDFASSPPTPAAASPTASPVFDAVQANDGWFVILDSVLQSTHVLPTGNVFSNPCITDHVFINEEGENTGGPGGGGGGVTPTPEAPPIVLQVEEEWEWQFTDGVLQVEEEWEWSDPSIGTLQIDEEWES